MDAFRARHHDCVCCGGGIYCPYDRPHPTSSAGARRLRDSKTLSRRLARRVVARDTRALIRDSHND